MTQNFTERPTNERRLYGYNATFKCVSVGVPRPKVSWVKIRRGEDGKDNYEQLLLNTRKYRISEVRSETSSNKTLVVHDVKYTDEGRYMCLSQSPKLERNVSATLDVYGEFSSLCGNMGSVYSCGKTVDINNTIFLLGLITGTGMRNIQGFRKTKLVLFSGKPCSIFPTKCI